MDHTEARELLEDAAVEPGGFERLTAGDTPNAALLAGHLAGCIECAGRWSGSADRRRDPAGRPGGAAARTSASGRSPSSRRSVDPVAPTPRASRAVPAAPAPVDRRAGRDRAASPPVGSRRSLAMAAVLVLAVIGTGLVVAPSRDAVVRGRPPRSRRSARSRRWTTRVEPSRTPKRIELASATGDAGRPGRWSTRRRRASSSSSPGSSLAPPGRQGVPLLGRGRRRAQADRQDVLRRRHRLLGGRRARRSPD